MPSYLGMGVRLAAMGDTGKTDEALALSLGKTIKSLRIDETVREGVLIVEFTDGRTLHIYDSVQMCSESRYIRTDDDLAYYVGAQLRDVQIREAPPVPDEDEVHEVQFLVLVTDKGNVTFSNHNEHNGGYGGFWIEATLQ